MNNHLKSILAAGVLTVASLGFTACNSENNDTGSAANSHTGHESPATTAATVIEVPDYSPAGNGVKEPLGEVFRQYIQMKDALVAASTEQARTAAQGLIASLGKIDEAALSGEQQRFFAEHSQMIRQHAEAIAGSDDIAAQRGQLDMLSESTYSLVKAFGANEQTLYYQHCPMANNDRGGNWISQTSEIKNPYFGEKMLKCGETKETLN
jgi:hypothetical protein